MIGAMPVIATACGRVTEVAAAPKPPEVVVAEVQQQDVPLYREWIGTVDGFDNAEINAQVSGYLVKQEYIEGSSGCQGGCFSRSIPGRFGQTWIRPKGGLRNREGSWSRRASCEARLSRLWSTAITK
jgi:membrane fusion protein (multidrug efflux system)